MNRLLLPLCALLASACSTVVPMQTASVVPLKKLRVGSQFSVAGFCGNAAAGSGGIFACNQYPDGIPLPELRANGRLGVAQGFDLGLSLQGQGMVLAPERVVQLGATVDLKRELLRIKPEGGRASHILSVGFLTGGAFSFRPGLETWSQVETGVPLFYGLQFEHLELVASATLSRRFVTSPNQSASPDVMTLGFSFGAFKRDPSGVAVQLSYVTAPLGPNLSFLRGALQLQLGFFWDV